MFLRREGGRWADPTRTPTEKISRAFRQTSPSPSPGSAIVHLRWVMVRHKRITLTVFLMSSLRDNTIARKNGRLGAAIAYYSICSSCLLIVNKVALKHLPAPIILLSMQLWFAVGFVYILKGFGVLTTEPLTWETGAKFVPVVLSFLGTLFSNAKVLQFSNVETFITFRSSTPLILCICDYLFLGRHLPSPRSIACLFGLLVSCAGYALFDHAFDIRAYSWLAVWFASFTAYEVVVKHLCDTVAVDNWTRVVYTNAMAGAMLAISIPFAKAEHDILTTFVWTADKVIVVLSSCLIGIGVSHSAYVMRSECSATLSAVVGILCKVFTVLINIVLWDNHATVTELAFLAIGLLSGAFYEQAPLRVDRPTSDMTAIAPNDKSTDSDENVDGIHGAEKLADTLSCRDRT